MLVSCIVTAHDEEELLEDALRSVFVAIENAGLGSNDVEVLVSIDNPSPKTAAVCQRYSARIRLLKVMFGDLSLSRNNAVVEARGSYVTFLDGDDLWEPLWLRRSLDFFQTLSENEQLTSILHPEYSVYFSKYREKIKLQMIRQLDSESLEELDLSLGLAFNNLWSSMTFASRSTYLKFPYGPNEPRLGVGFEDWSFNVETVRAGVKHVIAPDCFHFIRVSCNSMRTKATRQRLTYRAIDKWFN